VYILIAEYGPPCGVGVDGTKGTWVNKTGLFTPEEEHDAVIVIVVGRVERFKQSWKI
jgi:hypothetical protein